MQGASGLQSRLPVFLRPAVCAVLLAAAVSAQPVAERPAEAEARVAALGAELLARYGMAPPPAGKEAAPRAAALSALELARGRAEALVALIRDAPARALEAALPAEALDELRARNPELAPHLEQRGEWEGAAALMVADDFERGRSWELHLLETPQGGALEAYGVSVGRRNGGRMRVSGIALRGRIAVQEVHPAPAAEPQNPELDPRACGNIGEQKTGVYLFYWRGERPPEVSAAQAREAVFGAENSLDYYVRARSFGRAWLSGEVLTPEPVEVDRDEYRDSGLSFLSFLERASGLTGLADRWFKRRIYISGPDLFSDASAVASLAACREDEFTAIWTETVHVGVLLHEFGHNTGLLHDLSIANGKLREYGGSTVMGSGAWGNYFNARQLLFIGWVDERNVVTVGEYDLGGSYALKFSSGDGNSPGSSPVALRIHRRPRLEDNEQWLGRITEYDRASEPVDIEVGDRQWLWVEGIVPPSPTRVSGATRFGVVGSGIQNSYNETYPIATYTVAPFPLETPIRWDLPAGRTWEDPNSPLSLRVEFTSNGLTVHVGRSDAFPLISSNGIALATGTPVVGRISPNALVSVFGRYFTLEGTRALTPELNAAGGVADNLAGICLEIAGERVPLFAVFPHQINAQAPRGLTPGTARFDVVRGCGTPGERRGHTEPVAVFPVSPAFFNFVSNPDGRNPVVALHGGGPALVGPPGAVAGAALTPAAPGETVTLFGTGFGPTEPALEAGWIPGVQAPPLASEVSFYFGNLEPPSIETVAGNGTSGYRGDGSAAVAARLNEPVGVALDGSGNLYIADTINNRIRKVDAAGVITTVAGNGTPGYGGDGGAAVAAQLRYPQGVALDGSGNLYIADSSNSRIRKVDTAGVITTVAGDGTQGYGGDGGTAVAAQLNQPFGVALDGSGNLYIADTINNRIRKVDAAGVITTVAAQLGGPAGVALDGAGNLYIAEWNNHRIRKVDAAGVITTVAGDGTRGYSGDGGAAVAAQLHTPVGVALDGSGNLYIADRFNSHIRKVDTAGVITTVAGNGTSGYGGDGGPATAAQLSVPRGVALDGAGNLYIADRFNHRIRRVSAQFKRSSDAAPLYAGAAPCCAGLYQFAVRLPDDLPDGNVPVIAVVQGVSTPTGPFLAIQRR